MRNLVFSFLLLFVAASAFPHAGEVHTSMGTITAVSENGSFTMKTTEGKELTLATSKGTTYKFADGETATLSDLAAGTRVVVTMSKDGKTATTVKLGAPKKK